MKTVDDLISEIEKISQELSPFGGAKTFKEIDALRHRMSNALQELKSQINGSH